MKPLPLPVRWTLQFISLAFQTVAFHPGDKRRRQVPTLTGPKPSSPDEAGSSD